MALYDTVAAFFFLHLGWHVSMETRFWHTPTVSTPEITLALIFEQLTLQYQQQSSGLRPELTVQKLSSGPQQVNVSQAVNRPAMRLPAWRKEGVKRNVERPFSQLTLDVFDFTFFSMCLLINLHFMSHCKHFTYKLDLKCVNTNFVLMDLYGILWWSVLMLLISPQAFCNFVMSQREWRLSQQPKQ